MLLTGHGRKSGQGIGTPAIRESGAGTQIRNHRGNSGGNYDKSVPIVPYKSYCYADFSVVAAASDRWADAIPCFHHVSSRARFSMTWHDWVP